MPSAQVKFGLLNSAGKLTSIIAAMMCGADRIDEVNTHQASSTRPAGLLGWDVATRR